MSDTMQTFLPYAEYDKSVQVLDNKRLGKQRVEVYQILIALVEKRGWINHPATKMWKDSIRSLVDYGLMACKEWVYRGFNDTCYSKISAYRNHGMTGDPWWLGIPEFHMSHRSNLLAKDPEQYREKFPDVEPGMPYHWPDIVSGVKVLIYRYKYDSNYRYFPV